MSDIRVLVYRALHFVLVCRSNIFIDAFFASNKATSVHYAVVFAVYNHTFECGSTLYIF